MEAIIDKSAKKTRRPRLSTRFMSEEEFEARCDEDVKAEWVDGGVIMHSPSTARHVLVNGWLNKVIGFYVEHRALGLVLGPEFQIRLPRRRRVPDLLFATNDRLHLVHNTYLDGPPDLAVEIVSPDSVERDWREKYLEYEAAGVPEYWVIDSYTQRLLVYRLDETGRYQPLPEHDGILSSSILPGFWLRPDWFWQDPLPNTLDVLRELNVL